MKCCDLICIVPLFWESKGESLALSPVSGNDEQEIKNSK